MSVLVEGNSTGFWGSRHFGGLGRRFSLRLGARSHEPQPDDSVEAMWAKDSGHRIVSPVLPEECLVGIFSFLDPETVWKVLPQVCSAWRQAANARDLWRQYQFSKWGVKLGLRLESWRSTYILHAVALRYMRRCYFHMNCGRAGAHDLVTMGDALPGDFLIRYSSRKQRLVLTLLGDKCVPEHVLLYDDVSATGEMVLRCRRESKWRTVSEFVEHYQHSPLPPLNICLKDPRGVQPLPCETGNEHYTVVPGFSGTVLQAITPSGSRQLVFDSKMVLWAAHERAKWRSRNLMVSQV